MTFRSRTEIKGQALADFIVKFTYSNTAEVTGMANNTEAAKMAEVREKENLYLQKGMLKSGPYIWMVPPLILSLEPT